MNNPCIDCGEREADTPATVCELCQLLRLSMALFNYTGVLHTVTPRDRIVGTRARHAVVATVEHAVVATVEPAPVQGSLF